MQKKTKIKARSPKSEDLKIVSFLRFFMLRASKLRTSYFVLQRGISLYFAITVMAILLAIGLGLSTLIISQMKMIREMGDSVIALHAADTGIERALYGLYQETPQQDYVGTLNANITYRARITQPPGQLEEEKIPDIPEDPNCRAEYYCLKSIGTFRGIKRAIEASY